MASFRFVVLCFAVVLSSASANYKLTVGIISGTEDDSRQNSRRFWSSNDTSVVLQPVVQDVPWWSSLQVTRAVCSLLKDGVHALLSGIPPREYQVLQSYSSRFRIPLITTVAPRRLLSQSGIQVSMTPSPAEAVAALMKYYEWKSFVYFYDNDEGLSLLQDILELSEHSVQAEAVWFVSSGEEAQRYLQWVKFERERPRCILLSTQEHLVDEIIATLSYGSAARGSLHFMLADPVGVVDEGSKYEAQGSFMITKLALGSLKHPGYLDLENRWHTLFPQRRRGSSSKVIPYSALLMRDAADVLRTTVKLIHSDRPLFNMTSSGVNCLEGQPANAPDYGSEFARRMKRVSISGGMTGRVQFADTGERMAYEFEVTETTPSLVKKVGTWSSTRRKALMMSEKPTPNDPNDISGPAELEDNKVKYMVTSILIPPYLSLNKSSEAKGNEKFQGFVKDFLDALCDNLGCEYELKLVKDGYYGVKKVEKTGAWWNGMIGEVMREEVDMAVAPLTITQQRQEAVDFSKPFMMVGLNVLMKKPGYSHSTSDIGVLGFLQVWSYKVWLLVVLAYVAFGGATYAVSHFTGEPERIRSLDTKLSDRLSLASSFWFVLGSLTFRGTGIYPRSVSHRLLSVVWWTFSLVCFAFYVASLTYFVVSARTTTQTTHSLRRSSDVLQSFMDKGYPEVGPVAGGSSYRFFVNSNARLYKEYGKYLESHPELTSRSYAEGYQRVRASNGSYAMIMESSSSTFFSNSEPCDTVVTHGFLDQKSYGIAFKKGSLLRESFDHGMIELTEAGVLRNLYEKWWYHEKLCEDPYLNILPTIYSNSLTLNEVCGVFYVLIIGVLVACSTAAFEHFRQTKKLSVDN